MLGVPKVQGSERRNGSLALFEVRLAEGIDQLDVSVSYFDKDLREQLTHHPGTKALAAASPTWALIDEHARKMGKSSKFGELWCEFDEGSGAGAPSIFSTPRQEVLDMMNRKGVRTALGVANTSNASAAMAARLLDPILIHFWAPFWSAMPWLNQTQAAVRERIAAVIHSFPATVSLYAIGFWLSRDTGTVRLVLPYRGRPMSWEGIRAALVQIGYAWTDTERPTLLDDLMPQLLPGVSAVNLAVNCQEGGLTPKIGFELFFNGGPQPESNATVAAPAHNLSTHLDALSRLGLSSPDKAASLLDIGSEAEGGSRVIEKVALNVNGNRYKTFFTLSHLKVTFEPGKPVESKAYLLLDLGVAKDQK